jgi:putative tryptophan/tyrosine transport system substrate-binding protein
MRRRGFITLIGGAVIGSPFVAHAQQPAPGKWRIGLLMQRSRQDPLLNGLRKLGYIEGNNLLIEVRPNDRADQLVQFAAELVALKPDVIATAGTQATQAVQQATKSIPIVMVASDPVENHLVASLARPGGNTSGFSLVSPELSGKRIELLQNMVGELSPLVVLWNPADPPAAIAFKQTQDAARAKHLELLPIEARYADDFAPAFEAIAKVRPKGLVILSAPLMNIYTSRIAEFALSLKLPSIYIDGSFPRAGGLMSYGPDFDSIWNRAATYVDRILKGEKPANLPVEQPTKFDLVINLRTAKALGLGVPQSLLVAADETIE